MRLRAARPFAIPERSWAIFAAYCYEERGLDEIARRYQLAPVQVRTIVDRVVAQLWRARGDDANVLGLESAVEDLGLSMRTRNTLRSLGCGTVEDIIRLDLSGAVRGLGRKTREELLQKLERAGFYHPTLDRDPASDVQLLERSLERMRGRVTAALAAVDREIGYVKQRLRKKMRAGESRATALAPSVEDAPAGVERMKWRGRRR